MSAAGGQDRDISLLLTSLKVLLRSRGGRLRAILCPGHADTCSESLLRDGQTFAPMPMTGMEPNFFTINGKAFPATEELTVKKGERVRLRLIGIGQFIHPMHLHGIPFKIVATDGHAVRESAQLTKDTVSVAPGERYDIEFVATEPGQWMFHCHILDHAEAGLMSTVDVGDTPNPDDPRHGVTRHTDLAGLPDTVPVFTVHVVFAMGLSLGAAVVQHFDHHTWMRDPEGNDFCITDP